jgi:phosphatidylinositol phospholipase C delta
MKNPQELCEYTRKHLIRVYPAGKRIDSSNYDPIPAFQVGA